MNNLDVIISKIEEFAPLGLAQEWDNSGWQVYLGNNTINKIMLALSPTIDIIEDSINKGCELLITHHPLIFSGIKSVSSQNSVTMPVIKAIQGNLQIYCAHTNLDVTEGGIADVLVNMLNLENSENLNMSGIGRKAKLPQPESLDFVINKIKQVLNIEKLRLINPAGIKNIRSIAVLPGSGGSILPDLEGVDLYITGDIKYHDALFVKEFAVIDAGHPETERIILPVLKELLEEFDTDIFIAEDRLPWNYV